MTRCAAISYSADEMAWLEANRMMIISDFHQAFCAEFGRSDVTPSHLHGLRKRKGWKVGRTVGRFVGRHLRYSAAEIAWLRDNCTLPVQEYHRAFAAEFHRHDVSAANLHGLRKREGWKTGRTGHFEKGNVSHNKGKPCPPGKGGRHPNAQATQFKKGLTPHNFRGPGRRVDRRRRLHLDCHRRAKSLERSLDLARPQAPAALGTGQRPGARRACAQVPRRQQAEHRAF